MVDDLTLFVGQQQVSGWNSIRVTRGIERIPSDFEIEMTERYPGEVAELVIQPGDACQVKLGSDLVITGYVDRFMPSIEVGRHSIRVTGRGKCQDLVDCAAEWPGGQILNSSVLQIAQKLASYYGITVTASGDDGRAGLSVPQFNLLLGETGFEIIERICRYRALLAYDGADGNLILSGVGTVSAASGFAQGVNVQRASASYSMDQRYSEYVAFLQSTDVFTDLGDGGNQLGVFLDKGVSRHRRHVIISEAGGGGMDVCLQRAAWEAARRFGRSGSIAITTDSWRDSAGILYEPNTLVPISIPILKTDGKTWLISQVTYKLNENGTTCDLVMMPPDAFSPQPILLQPFQPDVTPGTQ